MTEKRPIPTDQIGSLPDYLQLIEQRCTGERNVLFRGHTNAEWMLEPKIARLRLRSGVSLLGAEREMLRDFKRQALPHLTRDLRDDWDWLALAQHHGLPTRLLDWSTNALVALWFAIEKPPEDAERGAVWMYFGQPGDYLDEQVVLDPFDTPRTLIFRPRHLTPRIIAQSGWFTAHRYLPKRPGFVPLETNTRQKPNLRKITIPTRYFPVLREDLARCGIKASALFGDLGGICRQLTWEHSPLLDEIEMDALLADVRTPAAMPRLPVKPGAKNASGARKRAAA
jgi:FRG domain